MRAGRIAAFAFGFAAGMASLVVVLWAFGALRAPVSARRRPFTPATTTVPATELPPGPVVATIPSSELPPLLHPAPIAPPGRGEADRAAPGRYPDHPVIPVQGVTAHDLTDTYDAARDGRRHEALDIMAPRGTPVIAAVEGNVVKLFRSKLGGVTVYQFDDSQTYCYYYAHLDRYATGLAEGTLLRQGQVLGYVGSTGNASAGAPHLHFEVHRLGPEKKWWHGDPVDPFGLLR